MKLPAAAKLFLLYSWRPWSKPEKRITHKIIFDNPLGQKEREELEEDIFLRMKITEWYVSGINEVCVVTIQHAKWMDSVFDPQDLPATIKEVSDGLTKAGFLHKPPTLVK